LLSYNIIHKFEIVFMFLKDISPSQYLFDQKESKYCNTISLK